MALWVTRAVGGSVGKSVITAQLDFTIAKGNSFPLNGEFVLNPSTVNVILFVRLSSVLILNVRGT